MNYSELELNTLGYIQYRQSILFKPYADNTLNIMVEHRNAIMAKYKDSTDKRVRKIIGMGMTEGMFIPLNYDGVFVDEASVFAIGYVPDYEFRVEKKKNEKYFLFTLFTNDEYCPVLSMVYVQQYNFVDSVFGRKKIDLIAFLESKCGNLAYPICEMTVLDELIRNEHAIKGRIGKSFMLEQIYDALHSIGINKPETISCEYGALTRKTLNENGYIIKD